MVKLKLIAALACLSLAACQPGEPVNNNVSTGGAEQPGRQLDTPVMAARSGDPTSCGLAAGTLVDERVLYAAETAYNIPAHAYVQADGTGKLSAETKAKVKPLLIEAYRHLTLARSAYKLGDVCKLNTAAVAAKNFAGQARAYF